MKKMKWLIIAMIVVLALSAFLAACTNKDDGKDQPEQNAETPSDNTTPGGNNNPGTNPGGNDNPGTNPGGNDNPGTDPSTPLDPTEVNKTTLNTTFNAMMQDEDSVLGAYLKNALSNSGLDEEVALTILVDKLVDAGFTAEHVTTLINDLKPILDLFKVEAQAEVAATEPSLEEGDDEIDEDDEIIFDFDNLPIDPDSMVGGMLDKFGIDAITKSFVAFVKSYVDVLADEDNVDIVCNALTAFIDDLPVDAITNLVGLRMNVTVEMNSSGKDFTFSEEDFFALYGNDANLIASLFDHNNSIYQLVAHSEACQTVVAELLGAAKGVLAEDGGNRAEFKAILTSVSEVLDAILAEDEEGLDGDDTALMAPEDEDIDENDDDEPVEGADEEGYSYEGILDMLETFDYSIINNVGKIIVNFATKLDASGKFEPALTEMVSMIRSGSETEIDFDGVLTAVKFVGAVLTTAEKDNVIALAGDITTIVPMIQELKSNKNEPKAVEMEKPYNDPEPVDPDDGDEDDHAGEGEEEEEEDPMAMLSAMLMALEPTIKDVVALLQPAYNSLSAADQTKIESLFAQLVEKNAFLKVPEEETAPLGKLLTDVTAIAAKPSYEEATEGKTADEIAALTANDYYSEGEIIGYVFSTYIDLSSMFSGKEEQKPAEGEPAEEEPTIIEVHTYDYIVLPLNATDKQILDVVSNGYVYLPEGYEGVTVTANVTTPGFTTILVDNNGEKYSLKGYVVASDKSNIIITYYDIGDVKGYYLPKPLENEDYSVYDYINPSYAPFAVYDRATLTYLTDRFSFETANLIGVDTDQKVGFYGGYFVSEDVALGTVYVPFVYYLYDSTDTTPTDTYFKLMRADVEDESAYGWLCFEYNNGASEYYVSFSINAEGEIHVYNNDLNITDEDITFEGSFDLDIPGEYDLTFTYGEISKTVKFTVYDNGGNDEPIDEDDEDEGVFSLVVITRDAEHEIVSVEPFDGQYELYIHEGDENADIIRAIIDAALDAFDNEDYTYEIFFGFVYTDGYAEIDVEALEVYMVEEDEDEYEIEIRYCNEGVGDVSSLFFYGTMEYPQ